jgi:hypothetical protein
MEEARIDVTPAIIANHMYFEDSTSLLEGTLARFVFNMNEISHQERVSAQAKKCLVHGPVGGNDTVYPVPRSGNCITLLACIAADGSFVRPAIIIPRKTYKLELFTFDLIEETLLVLSQPKEFVSRDLFM